MREDRFRHEVLYYANGVDGFLAGTLSDLDGLDEEAIEASLRSHPIVAHADGSSETSAIYEWEHEPPRPFEGPLPAPTTPFEERAFSLEELGALRRFVSSWATEEMLDVERSERLVLAVNELASNSIRHGGGEGRLRIWRESQTLLCEIEDRGQISEPLAGRSLPPLAQDGGRGLWLVNQLCDLVQIRSSPGGSVVRAHMRVQ